MLKLSSKADNSNHSFEWVINFLGNEICTT